MGGGEHVTGLSAEPVSKNTVHIPKNIEGLTRVVIPIDNAVTSVVAAVDICERIDVDMHVAMRCRHN